MKETIRLEQHVDKAMQHRLVHGFSIHVHHEGNDCACAQGNLADNRRFFAASVTKLLVTTLVLKLEKEKRLTREDKIVKHLGDDLPKGFHTYKGKDYTDELVIRHLMSNTSGLPDYFDKDVMNRLLANEDETWGFKPVADYVKDKEALAPPGQKAKYCDTNYQLLGAIIEKAGGKPFTLQVEEEILRPLGMDESYMYDGRKDEKLVNIFYKDREIVLPKYLASIGAEGGLVSTAKDLNIFLRAFFSGKLFPAEWLEPLYQWRLLFGPGLFFYGIGVSMQPIHLFKLKKGLIGHWGHSGAFAFYHPGKNVYMSGTVNQFVGHNKAVRVMLSVLKEID